MQANIVEAPGVNAFKKQIRCFYVKLSHIHSVEVPPTKNSSDRKTRREGAVLASP